MISFDPSPNLEALALLEGKPVVTREVFDALLPELRGLVFTVTGIASADTLQRIRDTIADLARGGQTWDQVQQSVIDELDPYLGDAAEQRAITLMRTQAFAAFQAGTWQAAQADADTTHLQYLATEDTHVRATHLALNGIVLPKDDPFWAEHYPPWEWGCRCRVRPMNPDMVDETATADLAKNPEDRNVITGPALDQLRNGTLLRDGQRYDVSASEDPGAFHFDPNTLNNFDLVALSEKYDAATWSAFVTRAQSLDLGTGQTLWQWLNGVT